MLRESLKIKETVIYTSYSLGLPYNESLKDRARLLRKAGVLSEVLFWKQVNRKKFYGIDFDRQRVIGNYIVDFYVKSLNLVIEIDGSSHNNKQDYDLVRQKYLEDLGLRVYRIKDSRVKNDIKAVIQELENYIVSEYSTPRPDKNRDTPLPEGNL